MNEQQAIEIGAADGIEEVDTVCSEQGRSVVVATLKPGHVAWDESAINAGVAQIRKVPEELRGAYYASYAKAARAHAEEIAASAE